MRKVTKVPEKEVVSFTCDICGKKADGSWWEVVNCCGEVIAEYSPPHNIDLCKKHAKVFTSVADKWKQERYEKHVLSETGYADFIADMKEAEPSGEDD